MQTYLLDFKFSRDARIYCDAPLNDERARRAAAARPLAIRTTRYHQHLAWQRAGSPLRRAPPCPARSTTRGRPTCEREGGAWACLAVMRRPCTRVTPPDYFRRFLAAVRALPPKLPEAHLPRHRTNVNSLSADCDKLSRRGSRRSTRSCPNSTASRSASTNSAS